MCNQMQRSKTRTEKHWILTQIMTSMALKARTGNDFRLSDLSEQYKQSKLGDVQPQSRKPEHAMLCRLRRGFYTGS